MLTVVYACALIAASPLGPLPPGAVTVGGEIGDRIRTTIDRNFLELDIERDFAKPFASKEADSGFIGLGMLIDAAVHFAAHYPEPAVLARKEEIVRAAIAHQEADGYIGMLRADSRIAKLWDIHEMGYFVHGLAMDHRYFGEEASLDAARRAADYILERWAPGVVPGGGEITEYMAATGIETAMLALHGETGDARYLDFVRTRRELASWDGPIVTGRWGPIQGHVYAYLARCLGQLRLGAIDPGALDMRCNRRAWDFMTHGGLAVVGTLGQHECWHDTQEGAANLGETCATAYLIRWLRERLYTEPDAAYGDAMERAVFNALFAAQSPDGRRIRYYSPFEGPREYFKDDTYCCPNNYRRILAELPGYVYLAGGDRVMVNLYTPSTAAVTLEGGAAIALTQETNYPGSGAVRIRVAAPQPAACTLLLRIPAWCDAPTLRIDGETLDAPKPGTYHAVARTWRDGDVVELGLPMTLRLVRGHRAQAGRVAIMHGPRVFCLSRKANPALENEDLRLLTIDPGTLEGPALDLLALGLTCTVRAWRTTTWYPSAAPDFTLRLTEFPDPAGEAVYFHVPDPNGPRIVEDPMMQWDR